MTDQGLSQAPAISQLWDAVLEPSGDCLILIDDQRRVMAVNAAARRLLGRAQPPIGAELPLDAAPPPGQPARLQLQGQAISLSAAAVEPPGWQLLRLEPAPAPIRIGPREQQLHQVLMMIGTALELDRVLYTVVERAMQLLGADAGSLPLYNHEHDRLEPGHIINMPAPQIQRNHYRGVGVIWQLIDSGQPLLINDYPARPEAMPELVRLGVRALLAVPVRGGDRSLLAALALYHCRPGASFSQEDLELLQVIAQQTGIAMQNARLYQAALAESRRRQALHMASVEIGSALDLAELCQRIHRAARRIVPCEACLIALLDPQSQKMEVAYSAAPPELPAAIPASLAAFVCQSGASLRLSDPAGGLGALLGPAAPELPAAPALLAAPLSIGDQPIGALCVAAQPAEIYNADDLDALELLAATAAIAIQNARLFGQVQLLATTDPLTGVANRRHFYTQAALELERAGRYAKPLSLVMLDTDYFKAINDTYGHIAGDQVLQAIAARLRDQLRETDLLARFGGEEFVALLPETEPGPALLVADRLRNTIVAAPLSTDAGPIACSLSVGIAAWSPRQPISLQALLDRADQALYQAKSRGRNQVSVWENG